MPNRIQRQRTKGWRMPEGAVYVGRLSKWGNPAVIGEHFMVGDPGGHSWPFRISWCVADPKYADCRFVLIDCNATAVEQYRKLMATGYMASNLAELRGKDLACWCKVGEPCHADVLLELANK